MREKTGQNRSKPNQLIKASEILESISDGFLALDRDWRFTYINKQAASDLGLRLKDLVGENIWEKLPQFIGGELELKCREALTKGQPQVTEIQGPITKQWHKVHVYPSSNGISVYWRDITEHKHAEDSLRQSEERLKQSQEIAHLGSWEFDLASDCLTWSDEVYRIFGLKPQEFGATYESFLEAVHPNDRMAVDGAYYGSINEGRDSYEIVHRVIRKRTGEIRYVHEKCRHVRDKSGKIIRSIGMVQDITERKRAEESLQESREFQGILLNRASFPIVVRDADWVVRYVNPAFEELTGYSVVEVIGTGFPSPFWPAEEIGEYQRQNQTAFGSDKKRVFERRFRKKNGELFWVILNAVPVIKNNQLQYFIINWVDITERKKAEEALVKARNELEIRVQERTSQLSESEEKYRKVVENANELIVVAQDGILKFVNNKGLEITGYSMPELLSRPFQDFVHPADKEMMLNNFQKRSQGETVPNSYEFKIIHKDGRTKWLYVNAAGILWQGKPATLGLLTDITDRKNMEHEIKAYAQRITQVQEEERKRIAYELHDDTAQYLAILKLELDSLLQSGRIHDPKILEKLQFLEKDAGRAIDDVRRYSHELRPGVLEHLGLQAALEQIADDINKLKQITVDLTVVGEEQELGEEVKLGLFRIVQESLNNVRKHAKASTATISLQFNDSYLKVMVKDNGVGFNLKAAANQTSLKGSLGLMSMQERAKLIGANLKIDSESGKGTTVSVEIPL